MKFVEVLNKIKNCFMLDKQVKVFDDCIQYMIAEEIEDIEVTETEIIRVRGLGDYNKVIFDVRLKGVKKE